MKLIEIGYRENKRDVIDRVIKRLELIKEDKYLNKEMVVIVEVHSENLEE